LTYSNWESVMVCFSESFESLSAGLQKSLWEVGAVPEEHRTDSLSAAVKNLKEEDEFTERYQGLEEIKLTWATFQVMRRTHASLSRKAGVDPKLVADQLGHGLGVSLDVYTVAGLEQRLAAVHTLEQSLLTSTTIN
jgi:hypothetical protein